LDAHFDQVHYPKGEVIFALGVNLSKWLVLT
jgi:hypothetical protein